MRELGLLQKVLCSHFFLTFMDVSDKNHGAVLNIMISRSRSGL